MNPRQSLGTYCKQSYPEDGIGPQFDTHAFQVSSDSIGLISDKTNSSFLTSGKTSSDWPLVNCMHASDQPPSQQHDENLDRDYEPSRCSTSDNGLTNSADVPRTKTSVSSVSCTDARPISLADAGPIYYNCDNPETKSPSPTKSLREGAKGEHRKATIPTWLLGHYDDWSDDESTVTGLGRNDFALRIRIYEDLNFEAVPTSNMRFRFPNVRNSFRGRVNAITSRLSVRRQPTNVLRKRRRTQSVL